MFLNGVEQVELIASASQAVGTTSGTAKPTFYSASTDVNRSYKGRTKRGRLILMASVIGSGTIYGVLQGRVPGADGTQAYHWYTIATTDVLSANGATVTYITDHIPPHVRGQVVTATGVVTGELHLEISN